MRIIYLDLDALRPDHLGCYGYHRNTSPNIDRIAEQGVRFDNYYCSDAPCLPSRSALTSGRYGIHTGIVGHGGTAATMRNEGPTRGFRDTLGQTSLATAMKQQGKYTAYIGGFGERHTVWTFYAGFREIQDTGMGGMESAEHVTPTVMEWLDRNAEKDDWFVHINYWDPHTPYRAPTDYGEPFADEPLPDWITPEILAEHWKKVGPHGAREINMYTSDTQPGYPRHPGDLPDMDALRKMFDGYDTSVRYMDEHIGKIFAALEAKGVLEETAIIISADHGENMGELGIYGEHATADQGTCRIPMIVRWPGGKQGHVDTGLHLNIDLAPTLAELGGTRPKANWDGQSFASAIIEGAECGRDYAVISQCAHVCQRSVRFGPWLYMRTYHDGYHLFPKEMLFNLEEDPFEQRDRAESDPETRQHGSALLSGWHDEMMATMPEGYSEDPMQTVLREGGPLHARGFLEKYAERLEATDRGDAVPELKRRHPQEFE